jgi:organic radical activating enzyme
MNCSYCYNKHVVFGDPNFSLNDIEHYYDKYVSSIFSDLKIGIVFSGGEPTHSEHFVNVVNYFRNKGNDLAVQTNGIKIPNIDNFFHTVILSLKTDEESKIEMNDYISILKESINYYGLSTYKELRIVDIPSKRNKYNSILNNIDEDLFNNNFKIQYVDPV